MHKVVGIRFKEVGKIYYFDPNDISLKLGDDVIVETVRGLEFGHVVVSEKEVGEDEIVPPLRKVLKKADENDRAKVQQNRQKAEEAVKVWHDKVRIHNLPMKLIDVEYTFDNTKLIFYFTADGRIDFRELVKDLASVFRTRIELRQIGVRDEAKMIGGIGLCGRQLCCATFLGDFDPVSIRMAKDQNLSLNPTKISGVCGRLMCCLRFESETYDEAKSDAPDVGEIVTTPQGTGKVIQVNIFENTARVQLPDEAEIDVPLENITQQGMCTGCKDKDTDGRQDSTGSEKE